MELMLQGILLILLMIITYQDYKFRAVSWILFPALAIISVGSNLLSNSLNDVIENIVINSCFILFLLLNITIYFSVKHKRFINISNGFIGWGDILFLFCLAILLSPLNFIFFYVVSLTAIISVVVLFKLILKDHSDQIPLAGLQAFVLILVISLNYFISFGSLTSDYWIVNLLM